MNDPKELTESKPSPLNDDCTLDVANDKEEEGGHPEKMEDGDTVDDEEVKVRGVAIILQIFIFLKIFQANNQRSLVLTLTRTTITLSVTVHLRLPPPSFR